VVGLKAGSTRARYLIPIYPGLALLVGEFLAAGPPPTMGARPLVAPFYAFAVPPWRAGVALSPAARRTAARARPVGSGHERRERADRRAARS